MKLLEVIIPHYKEREEIIEFNLRMLQLQQSVDFKDFEVCITNDGPDAYEFPSEFLDQFKPLKIKQIRSPKNGGSGYCRNYGMDNTTSKYILFIDADDGLASVASLYNFFKVIKDWKNPDIISSEFIYEDALDETYTKTEIKVQTYSDNTWLHGKVFKRSALVKYGIRFFDDVRYNEDSCFNLLLCTDKLKRVKNSFISYIARAANKTSLCKSVDSDYICLRYIEAVPRAIQQMKEKPDVYNIEKVKDRFYDILCFAYFTTILPFGKEENREKYINEVLGYIVNNWDLFSSLSDEWKAQKFKERTESFLRHPVYNQVRNQFEKLTYINLENFIKDEIKRRV